MNTIKLQTILFSLFTLLAVGCGDVILEPIDDFAPEDEQGQFDEQDDVEDENLGEDDEQNEVADEEDEQDDDNVEDAEEIFVPGVCGDNVLDRGEACDDGNNNDNDGCSSECAVDEVVRDIEAKIAMTVTVDDLTSNAVPQSADCVDAEGVFALSGANRVTGTGRCDLPANSVFYDIDATANASGILTGTITLVMNNRENVVEINGRLRRNGIELEFFGVTLFTENLRIIWDGEAVGDL